MVTSGYVDVDGLDVYHEVHGGGGGTAAPLVLLHGGLLTIDLSFGAILAPLAARGPVVAIELQGHGRTADGDRPLDLGTMADDVVAVLDHLGIDRADVLGFSLGGMVAVTVAVRHPDRVRLLVAASVPFGPDGYHDPLPPELLPTEADFAAMVGAYRAVAPDPDHFEAFAGRLQAVVGAFRGWTDDELQGLAAPTLVLVGDQDFVRLDHAVASVGRLPAGQLAVLPATTHMGVLQDQARVLALLEPFLSDPA
jgi:pimeloyl-ACP methyl ester carboxylesterase